MNKPFEKYEVDVSSVDELIDKYYKKSRLNGIEDTVRNFHKSNIKKSGYTVISRHESTTGQPVCYRVS